MLEISTLLRHGEDFVPVEKFAGPIPDEDYIEGAIELSIDGRPLLTRAEWAYVDQLWAYLVDGLINIQSGRPFKTYFPDQPIEVTLTPDVRGARVKVHVTINRNTLEASTSLPIFITELTRAARHFFERMQDLLPKATYAQLLAEISRLEETQVSRTSGNQSSSPSKAGE